MKQNYLKSYLKALVLILVLIGLDQYTKILAIEFLKGTDGIDLIQDVFKLQYLENRGAAFGIMQGQKACFVIVGSVVTIMIGFLYGKFPLTKKYVPIRVCGILLIAGAIGNMIDRIFYGFVVDFFYFELINFPIFNVADIYVTLSTILLVVLILFYYKDEDMKYLTFKKIDRSEDESKL